MPRPTAGNRSSKSTRLCGLSTVPVLPSSTILRRISHPICFPFFIVHRLQVLAGCKVNSFDADHSFDLRLAERGHHVRDGS